MAGPEPAPEGRPPDGWLCSFAGTARQLGAHRACCRPASQAGRAGDAGQARRCLLCENDPGQGHVLTAGFCCSTASSAEGRQALKGFLAEAAEAVAPFIAGDEAPAVKSAARQVPTS